MTNDVDSGPVWNARDERWERSYVSLPQTKHGTLILVPKVIARIKPSYDANQYYRHFVMPAMQQYHKELNSSLVRTVRTGKEKGKKYVTKKDLYVKYGADKLTSANLTADHPSAIDKYRKHKKGNHTRPLDNIAFAKLENIAPPDYNKLLQDVRAVLPGNLGATQYEDAIERLLSALLYPSLTSPLKQHEIHEGRKRIDITYSNVAQAGFFDWIGRRYPAANIFVECKNYGKDVGNPEIDQLAGRFSPSRGQFGLLVVRSVANRALLDKRSKDTADDSRGFIICLDDNDLQDLIKQRESIINGYNDNLLWRRFQKLIS